MKVEDKDALRKFNEEWDKAHDLVPGERKKKMEKNNMYKILLIIICLCILVVGRNAFAGDLSVANATDICWDKIDDLYPGSDYVNPCRVTDMGDTLFIVWNMACPFILADPTTGPRRTGSACEVNKNTGEIVYLAVSARELIK